MNEAMELLKTQRTVVEGSRKTKSILDKVFLSRTVAAIHRRNLRYADMALINHHEVILREEVEQTVRSHTRLTPIEIARIVLDTRTMTEFLNHLNVILYSFLDTLCLDMVANLVEEVNLFH